MSADRAAGDLRFADALTGYRAALAADPSAACASAARARAEDLEAHSEGGFVPLATLEAVRRDPSKMEDPAAIDALAAAIGRFPPGRVRVEARITLAHAWQHHLGDPVRAIGAYTDALRDTSGDRLTRALALTELWNLRRQRGEIAEALAEVERAPDLSPSITGVVRRAMRHRRIDVAACTLLAALALCAIGSIVVLVRRARDVRAVPGRVLGPFIVAFSLYLGGGAALLVRARDDGDPRPFLWFGIAVLLLGGVARALPMAARVSTRLGRTLWATACVLGVLAAAFLAVEHVDAGYFAGIGL